MFPLLTALAVVAALLGGAGLYWVNRRRFARRNAHGVEVFRSYGHMLAARAVDTSLTLVFALLACAGGAFALYATLQH